MSWAPYRKSQQHWLPFVRQFHARILLKFVQYLDHRFELAIYEGSMVLISSMLQRHLDGTASMASTKVKTGGKEGAVLFWEPTTRYVSDKLQVSPVQSMQILPLFPIFRPLMLPPLDKLTLLFEQCLSINSCYCNNITLDLAMYRPKNPTGVVFFCPGGTDAGAAATWPVSLNQDSNFWSNFSGLEDYDLMAMDIRATWSSNKLDVSLDTIAPFLAPFPMNQNEYNAFKSASKTMLDSFSK